jgi:octaprenyl-diphosphate synthase
LSERIGRNRARGLGFDAMSARAEIMPLVAQPLREVEALFRANLASPIDLIDEIGDFVRQGGGKRVRPMLHLLGARLCGYEGPHDVVLGTVVELIHCATLIHDDIIDGATTRRGRESANRRWGNDVTVLFGDYMFAKAMHLALRAESLQVMERLADVTLRMTEGEMLQTRYVGRLDISVEQHLELVEKKTAALFGCCCELAAMLAGSSPERVQAMARYGRQVGMAFQLVDDLLDFTGDAETLGKPAASDLREGKATLAVLDLLGGGSKPGRALALSVIESPNDPLAIARLTDLLYESGAIARAHERARFHARAALAQLEGFADGPANRALRALPDLLLARDR